MSNDYIKHGVAVPKACTIARTEEDSDLNSVATERSQIFRSDNIIGFGKPESTGTINGRYASETQVYLTDSDGVNYGFDTPNIRVNQIPVAVGSSSVVNANPHFISDWRESLPSSGGVIYAMDCYDTSLSDTLNRRAVAVGVIKSNLDLSDIESTDDTPNYVQVSDSYATTSARFPTISISKTNRLLYLFFIGIDIQGNHVVNVYVYRNGFSKIATIQLWTGTKTIRRMRVENIGSESVNRWMLLIHVEESSLERTYQYAGFSPTSMRYISSLDGMSFPEISWNSAELLVFSQKHTIGTSPDFISTFNATVRRMADPFQPLSYVTESSIGALTAVWYDYVYSANTSGIAVARSNDGTLYVYGSNKTYRSVTGGVSWESIDGWNKISGFYDGDTTLIIPRDMTAAELSTGQVLVGGVWKTHQEYYSVTAMVMGGWATRTYHDYKYLIEDSYAETWSGGVCEPDDAKYGKAITGSVTTTLNDGKYYQVRQNNITSTFSISRPGTKVVEAEPEDVTFNEGGFAHQATVFHWLFHAVSNINNGEFATFFIGSEGFIRPKISVKIGTEGIRFRDEHTDTDVASYSSGTTPAYTGKPVEFIVYFGLGKVRIFWRECDVTTAGNVVTHIRKFNSFEFTPAQPDSGSTDDLEFSYSQGLGHTGVGRLYYIDWAPFTELSNPYINDDIKPKRLGGYYTPSWIHSGALASPSKTALPGELWSIATASRFALENALPLVEPRPAMCWRNDVDNVEQEIVFKMGAESEPLGKIGAFIFKGVNFRSAQIYRWTGSAWALVTTCNNSTTINYSRKGRVIAPGSGQTIAVNLKHHELAGFEFELVSASGIRRAVIDNKTGPFLYGSEYASEILVDMQVGDASTGTARIIYPDAVVVFPADTETQYYKVVIPAQHTIDGYYRGKVSPAEVIPFMAAADNGRILQSEHNIEVKTYRAGSRVRTKRGERRYVAEFAWVASGVDESWSKVKTWGTRKAGTGGQTSWTVYGLRDAIQEQTPIVYISDMPNDDTGVTVMGRDRILYGFMTGDVSRLEQVFGSAGRSVYRIPSVRIEGEL